MIAAPSKTACRSSRAKTPAEDSDLSDPPSDLDDDDYDSGTNFSTTTIKSSSPRKASKMGAAASSQNQRRRRYSPLELAPNEVLHRIASYVADDRDFMSLASSCTTLSRSLIPPESAVWKDRFLSLYDCPLVDEHEQYAYAYQGRRFVLTQFVAFAHPDDERLKIQMEVLKDMVVETYLPSQSHLPAPLTSRNLAAFESPQNSPWMHTFMSTALYPSDRRHKFGQPHPLFDALQVCLSHLLLSPTSKMAHAVDTSRANYSLVQVYNWNQAFATLYRRIRLNEEKKPSNPWLKKKKFPKLKSRAPQPPKFRFELDMHALLHIRNFWHRHFIDDTRGFSQQPNARWIGEDTYAKMVKSLSGMGITPKKWDMPLNSEGGFPISSEWYGHYSCLHPWPKTLRDMEERQTCAEDWSSVDPMKLEFSTSQDNLRDGFWPPIFSCIPAFDNTVPNVDDASNKCTVIQGLANFVDLAAIADRRMLAGSSHSTLTVPKLPTYHPFLSLRLRGVIHPIEKQPTKKQAEEAGYGEEEQVSIPGWNRIVMVMYKPTKRYLIQVLEYEEENYGDAFGPVVSASMQLNLNGNGQQPTQPGQAGIATGSTTNATAATNNNTNPTQQQAPASAPPNFDPIEADRQLQAHLEQKLLSKPEWRCSSSVNPEMSREAIEAMENKFRSNYALDWLDMEYAYAYEGVVLPGGKIMMGRWWRCGLHGVGLGKELDAEGFPLDGVDDENANENGNANGNGNEEGNEDAMDIDGQDDQDGADATAGAAAAGPTFTNNKSLERGPFVFWC